jgi:hypothetical protein
MLILQTMRHSPESCPLGNPKNLDVMIKWIENLENLTAKYGIKIVGVWTDRVGHMVSAVFEVPSMKEFTNFEMDLQNIPVITFNIIEKKVVISIKETLAFFKERKIVNKHTIKKQKNV